MGVFSGAISDWDHALSVLDERIAECDDDQRRAILERLRHCGQQVKQAALCNDADGMCQWSMAARTATFDIKALNEGQQHLSQAERGRAIVAIERIQQLHGPLTIDELEDFMPTVVRVAGMSVELTSDILLALRCDLADPIYDEVRKIIGA